MANTGTLLLVGLGIVAVYGYTQGWFNQILGQLGGGGEGGVSFTPGPPRAMLTTDQGQPFPVDDIVWRTQGHDAVGPHHYDFEGNVAHISIA